MAGHPCAVPTALSQPGPGPGTAMGTLAHCFTPWCEHWGCHNNTPHPRDTCTLLGTWHSPWETGILPGDAGTAPGDIGTPVGTLTHTHPHPRGLAQCLGNWQNSWRCWHSPWGHRHAAGDGDTQPMGPSLRDTGTALRDTVTPLGPCQSPGDPVMSPGIPSHCWGPLHASWGCCYPKHCTALGAVTVLGLTRGHPT